MNIGIVTTWFERGAAYVSKAYLEILQKEHSVFIYARGGEEYAKGNPDWDWSNVTYAPRLNSCFIQGDRSMSRLHFAKWITLNNISVIIFNEQNDTSIVAMLSKNGYITGAYVDYYKKETVCNFGAYAFLLCNTKRHLSVFKSHKNPIFLQWGTNVNLFKPNIEKIDNCEKLIFFHSAGFGGINCRKGTDLLVEAFQLVKGPAKLLIHSQTPKESFGIQIAKIILEDKRIHFIEKTIKAPGLYHLGDVYVYPSRLDGIGLSVPEALSCGLPVITTDCPPMNEFVQDGENGFLVEVDKVYERSDEYYWPETIVNINDLAKKMQRYVDDRHLLEIHKYNARQSAISKFNWVNNEEYLLSSLRKYDQTVNPTISTKHYVSFLFEDIYRVCAYFFYRSLKYMHNYLIAIKNHIHKYS